MMKRWKSRIVVLAAGLFLAAASVPFVDRAAAEELHIGRCKGGTQLCATLTFCLVPSPFGCMMSLSRPFYEPKPTDENQCPLAPGGDGPESPTSGPDAEECPPETGG